jgi:hypothetical protein
MSRIDLSACTLKKKSDSSGEACVVAQVDSHPVKVAWATSAVDRGPHEYVLPGTMSRVQV